MKPAYLAGLAIALTSSACIQQKSIEECMIDDPTVVNYKNATAYMPAQHEEDMAIHFDFLQRTLGSNLDHLTKVMWIDPKKEGCDFQVHGAVLKEEPGTVILTAHYAEGTIFEKALQYVPYQNDTIWTFSEHVLNHELSHVIFGKAFGKNPIQTWRDQNLYSECIFEYNSETDELGKNHLGQTSDQVDCEWPIGMALPFLEHQIVDAFAYQLDILRLLQDQPLLSPGAKYLAIPNAIENPDFRAKLLEQSAQHNSLPTIAYDENNIVGTDLYNRRVEFFVQQRLFEPSDLELLTYPNAHKKLQELNLKQDDHLVKCLPKLDKDPYACDIE